MIIKIEQVQSHEWRNENPGEGGAAFAGRTVSAVTLGGHFFPAGSSVALGACGYKLVRAEGGFKSVRCRPVATGDGEVAVRVVNGCLIGAAISPAWREYLANASLMGSTGSTTTMTRT